ncbi:hypothetical protein FC699_19170 [Bacillus wiedmannii]|uniref:Uncharacterized protein n=1 Tax=Bacillus wiedmannii TaxID=1890302 RepID=A0A4U2MEQ7_9BACI|nr:hypothetical protein FC694_28135 [Bacillus wiedmannii]TKI92831.1 hypothetical protein FC699_19170 [Bacillus wiedmannii]
MYLRIIFKKRISTNNITLKLCKNSYHTNSGQSSVRRERKLTGFEWTMYFVTQFATLIWAVTYFIKHLAES